MEDPMLQASTISVLSVEETRYASPYARILVPTDGSELAREAATQALALAASTGAAVVFLTVNEPFHLLTTSTEMIEATREQYERQAEAHAEQILKEAGEAASDAGVPFITVRKWGEDPYLDIIDVAHERRCDLIAMGSHGRRGLSAVLLGSVTNKVLTHSSIPVLVVRRFDRPAALVGAPAGGPEVAGAGVG
jgi:nucleotide-binding universal stress UspA family protein